MANAKEISPVLLSDIRESLYRTMAAGKLEIPLLPDVAVEILNNPMREDTDIQKLTALVLRDQLLTANVLGVVNSAMFASDKRITSLQQAVMRLGLMTLRQLVMAVVLQSRIFDVPRYEDFQQDTWQRSALTAAYAREVANTSGFDQEVAFLSGLLHNVGKSGLLLALVDLGRQIPKDIGCVAVLEALPDLQLRAGMKIAETWMLPDEIRIAIEFQDNWEGAPAGTWTSKVTALSKILTHNLLTPGSVNEKNLHELALCKALGLTEERVEGLVGQKEKVARFAETFG